MKSAKALTIEAGKYYRTRSGKKALVAALEAPEDQGINPYVAAGLIEGLGAITWTREGNQLHLGESPADIVAEWVEPKRIKGWIAVGGTEYGILQTSHCLETQDEAREIFKDDYGREPQACIEIDVVDGHGLHAEPGR